MGTCYFSDRLVRARGRLNCVLKNLGPACFEAIHAGFELVIPHSKLRGITSSTAPSDVSQISLCCISQRKGISLDTTQEGVARLMRMHISRALQKKERRAYG